MGRSIGGGEYWNKQQLRILHSIIPCPQTKMAIFFFLRGTYPSQKPQLRKRKQKKNTLGSTFADETTAEAKPTYLEQSQKASVTGLGAGLSAPLSWEPDWCFLHRGDLIEYS